VVGGSKHHGGAVEIKITGQDFRHGLKMSPFAMKFHDAGAANAGFIPCFGWNLRDEFLRDFDAGAPAGAFVSSDGAKLAVVRQATKRA